MELKNKICLWLKEKIKPFFVHGDFENIPKAFDIADEEVSITDETKRQDPHEEEITNIGTSLRTNDAKVFDEEVFDEEVFELAYQYGEEDDLQKSLSKCLEKILKFEDVLDSSNEKLENRFDEKEYQYDTTAQ